MKLIGYEIKGIPSALSWVELEWSFAYKQGADRAEKSHAVPLIYAERLLTAVFSR